MVKATKTKTKTKTERRVFYNTQDCPVRNVVAQIGDKWSLLILFALVDGPDRFNDLKSRIEGISQRMLTQTLRDLEREGYVNRTVYPEVPVRVEYALTDLGKQLVKPLYELVQWAENHKPNIEQARAEYDSKTKG
ncbi:helix-turn-helix transcriptional regulator [Vibrio sp. SCSIO 43133]|uniref:winged helix-turn-helix transcriptional regulator n=1 Tax=Vibrio sp. SCSIO 43133 TaxID=2802577 RepID=UPI0020761A56|nr:helix-turn-helix domain-containing protein [Vibrio sp. SCSIO 43133]USD99777.1 helix-turn-helix transcriptional regulator [Vibrio sp. SCSIO 43133]